MLLDGILAAARDSSVEFSSNSFGAVMADLMASSSKPEEVNRKLRFTLFFSLLAAAHAHPLDAFSQRRRRAL
jgi:hypothetical protein